MHDFSVIYSTCMYFISLTSERRGGLVVSAPDSGSTGPGSALAGLLCCVLGQDTLLSQCLSSPRGKWVPANCQGNLNAGGLPAMD